MGKQIRSEEKTPFQSWYEKYVSESLGAENNAIPEESEIDDRSDWKKMHDFANNTSPKVLQEQFEANFKMIDSLMDKISKDSNYTDKEKGIILKGLFLNCAHHHELAEKIILHQRTQVGIERRNAQKKNSLYNFYKKDEK